MAASPYTLFRYTTKARCRDLWACLRKEVKNGKVCDVAKTFFMVISFQSNHLTPAHCPEGLVHHGTDLGIPPQHRRALLSRESTRGCYSNIKRSRKFQACKTPSLTSHKFLRSMMQSRSLSQKASCYLLKSAQQTNDEIRQWDQGLTGKFLNTAQEILCLLHKLQHWDFKVTRESYSVIGFSFERHIKADKVEYFNF